MFNIIYFDLLNSYVAMYRGIAMKIIGWITMYVDGSSVGECSPVYDMKEWLDGLV